MHHAEFSLIDTSPPTNVCARGEISSDRSVTMPEVICESLSSEGTALEDRRIQEVSNCASELLPQVPHSSLHSTGTVPSISSDSPGARLADAQFNTLPAFDSPSNATSIKPFISSDLLAASVADTQQMIMRRSAI